MSCVAPGRAAQCFLIFASVVMIASALRRRRRHHLVEDLVLLDHAELEARTLLDRFESLLQVLHFRVERIVARLEAHVLLALLREVAIELPHPEPASLADPERVLEREEERGEGDRECFHIEWIPACAGMTFISTDRKLRGRRSARLRPALLRCAGAGCTSPCGRNARGNRS